MKLSKSQRTFLLSRRILMVSAVALLAGIIAVPALAEFLGPDRTVLEMDTVRDPDNDVWTLVNEDPPPGILGVCLIIHTCEEHPGVDSYSPICLWGDPPNTNPAESSSCTRAYKDVLKEITYPEATISAELQRCELVDGWCTADPNLQLTGVEPVAGEAILLIEGTRNSEGFSCPGSACDIPLVQGENSFTFWALSSWGDSSQMGTLSAKVDSLPPSILIPQSWKIWEPLALVVDDGGTGLKSVSLTIHGGSLGLRKYSWPADSLPSAFVWDRYFGEVVAPIGEYPVTVQARDRVGNRSTVSATIVIPLPDSAPLPGAILEPEEVVLPTATPNETDPESSIAPTATQLALAAAIDDEQPPAVVESEQIPAANPRALVQPLWGAAAAALSYATMNFALSRRKSREEQEQKLREEVARANAERSIEKRTARIWESVKPIAAAISALNARRQTAEGELAQHAEPTPAGESGQLSAAEQASAERWQALADEYEAMQAEETPSAARVAREEAHARRRQEVADSWVQRQQTAAAEAAAEPALEEVPSFWSDPLGWAQASIINIGRQGMTSLERFRASFLSRSQADQRKAETDEPMRTPAPASTATTTPQPQPIPTVPPGTPIAPTPSAYQLQQNLNAKYGFCVYPLTDPDAMENRIAEGGMVFGKGPFPSLPGPAPRRTWEGYSTNPWSIALKGFNLVAKALRQEANLRAMATAEPNVDVSLHYSIYEDGVRVSGVRVENNYNLPISILNPAIYQGIELPDGSIVITESHAVEAFDYVLPGAVTYIEFEGLPEGPLSDFLAIQVHIMGSTVEYERQFRRIGWRINARTGEVEPVEQGWSEPH